MKSIHQRIDMAALRAHASRPALLRYEPSDEDMEEERACILALADALAHDSGADAHERDGLRSYALDALEARGWAPHGALVVELSQISAHVAACIDAVRGTSDGVEIGETSVRVGDVVGDGGDSRVATATLNGSGVDARRDEEREGDAQP